MIRATTITLFLTMLLLSKQTATAQKFNVHLFEDAPSYIETGKGQIRFLQTSVANTPDLQAAEEICNIQPPRFVCEDTIRIEADDLSFSDITLRFSCILDSFSAFDFRRSQGCGCEADIVSSDPTRPVKTCPCTICPSGFGDSPISIDCTEFDDEESPEDPFIIDQCSSLDCGFACNGTCAFDCVNSGPECQFCSNNPNVPTASPAGTALGNGGSFGPGNGGPINNNLVNGQNGGSGGGSSATMNSYGTAMVVLLVGAAWAVF